MSVYQNRVYSNFIQLKLASVCVVLIASCYVFSANACLTTSAVDAVLKQEIATLKQRIPPAFADTLEDGLIQASLTLQDTDTCTLNLTMQLPQADIDEAQTLLAAQPAKQIMLAAQGYRLPEQTRLQVSYRYDVANKQPFAHEILQTGALGQLRANVELMYAMLTQARANPANTSSGLPLWQAAQRQQAQGICSTMNPQLSAAACACWVNGMAEKVTYRQLTYYQYLNSNPYAFASGQGASLKTVDKALQQQCKQP